MNITTDRMGSLRGLNDDLYWLTSIKTPKDEVRAHITHVYFKGDSFYKTDGHRLHRVKVDRDCKEGFYQVLKRTKSCMILGYNSDVNTDYPDCDPLLEKPSGAELIVKQREGNSSKAFAVIIRAMDGNALHYDYLNDVLASGDVFNVTIKDSESPIHFEDGNKAAIIMPIRI